MPDIARNNEELATQRRARLLGLNYFDTSQTLNKQIFRILGAAEIEKFKVVPIAASEHDITFGITNNTSRQTMDQINKNFSDHQISFALISDAGFREYLNVYNPPPKVDYKDISIAPGEGQAQLSEINATLASVRSDDVLAYLVKQAYQLKGSDIHLECQKDNIRVRIRVDGVLHKVAEIAKDRYHGLMSSIAVAGNISASADEAQSGHINKTYKLATGEEIIVNLRIETIPTAYGQDVVMRLFNFDISFCQLDNLGLAKNEREVLDAMITRPSGMVIIVGPTGSGKTTTLYSIINSINSEEKKIITLEDPVEFNLPGVVQIPVNGAIDAPEFTKKLRATLRLDPDVLMIGEIRDSDTARTALQAALTGHLVLSTFHANSAAAALTRMLDAIGVNPLFANAVNLVMAQRLVRRLDDESKQPYKPDANVAAHIKQVINSLPSSVKKPNLSELTLYKPAKTPANPFGYKGQVPLREQMQMTPGVQKILRLPPNQITTDMIEQKAVEDGMVTMLQDGVLKALAGQTSIEEVYRVLG